MQEVIKKVTSKFVHHYQTIIKEKEAKQWKIEIKEIEERTYGEKERRIDYRKIGSSIDVIENVKIVEKTTFHSVQSIEGIPFKKIEKDMKKMYF